MKKICAAFLGGALVLGSSTALAHPVPGDPDPGRNLYILPGALISTGYRASGDEPSDPKDEGFVDLGVEVSVHRFVPRSGSTFLTQLGYGGVAQLQLGGIPADHRAPKDVGTSLRLALGAQGTYGLLGAQAGLMTRAGSETYGTGVGPFGGVFVSFGIVSAGVQVDVPVVSSGAGPRMPVLVTVPVTLKWVIPIEMFR